MLFFWVIIIALISVVWAFIALNRERNKKEMEKAKEDIAKDRVVFHSSDVSDSSSS
ncbi:MAG: hypothetical protein HYW63_02680 [Candidatus Levybacteria bacterium]|nr:hypothetical protein [Candidatus Levybacteria bacterium]